MKRAKKNRILYLDTSLRNPKRTKDLLSILYEYNNQTLTEKIAKNVEKKLIMEGIYTPNVISKKNKFKDRNEFNENEAEEIMSLAPQTHAGEGVSGYESRFRTHYFNMQQLGYIFVPEFGKKIIFGESAEKLVKLSDEERGKISLLHLNAMAKFQTNNPFINNANENIHLSLLVKLINLAIKKTGKSILKSEIPIIICWKDNDEKKLFEFINEYRKEIYKIEEKKLLSKKKKHEIDLTTLKFCAKIFNDKWELKSVYNKNTKKNVPKVKLAGTLTAATTILRDYPDVYFRYLKETTLIYSKKISNKNYILLDENQSKTLAYIEKNYSTVKNFPDSEDYFKFASTIDPNIFTEELEETLPDEYNLKKWISEFTEDTIKDELIKLANFSKSHHELLKDMDPSLRLEWLISLFIYAKVKNLKKFKPYYHVNNDGQAIRHANGESRNFSGVDIIAFENESFFTIEPTLLTLTRQYHKESFSNHKHLETEIKNNPGKKGYCLQISPEPAFETKRYAINEKRENDVDLIPISIENFIKKIEETNSLKALI